MNIILKTMSFNNCTVGKLFIDGELTCNTMEKPWDDNQANISCIPSGVYELNPCVSPKFGKTYCVENEKLGVSLSGNTKRTHILFHKANMESELQGCIAPVMSFGAGAGEWFGYSSSTAYNALMDALDSKRHSITIVRG